MSWLFLAIAIIILCFGLVVFFGAPYLPTLKPQAKSALDLIDLKPGETLLELGSGDGQVILIAAQAGLNVVGYELNPILVLISWIRTRRYRNEVKIIWGNFWTKDWPDADGIFVFLLPKYMKKLDTKITQWQSGRKQPVRLISFAFRIHGKKTLAEDKGGVYLYEYR